MCNDPAVLPRPTSPCSAAPGGMGGTKCAGNYSPVLVTQVGATLVFYFACPRRMSPLPCCPPGRRANTGGQICARGWKCCVFRCWRTDAGCCACLLADHTACLHMSCGHAIPLTCLLSKRVHPLPQLAAKKDGYSDVVYLDAKTDT